MSQVYDDCGSVDEDSIDKDMDWMEYWRNLFPKVSPKMIDEFMHKYHGSEDEKKDVKICYEKCKGDMNRMSQYLISYSLESEDRFVKSLKPILSFV